MNKKIWLIQINSHKIKTNWAKELKHLNLLTQYHLKKVSKRKFNTKIRMKRI